MKNHLNILPKRPHWISNALKCVGGWGSAPAPAGGASGAPPSPLIVRGNAPSVLATLYFVSISTSQFASGPLPYGIPGSATATYNNNNVDIQTSRSRSPGQTRRIGLGIKRPLKLHILISNFEGNV